MSDFPTITLSACEDHEDVDEDDIGVQRDTVIEVGEVCLDRRTASHH